QSYPALGNLLVRPACGVLGVYAQHHMHVIAHDCVGQHRQGKDPSKFEQARLDPILAVIEAAPSQCIFTTEKGPPHAACDAVVAARSAGNDQLGSWVAHEASLAQPPRQWYRTSPLRKVGIGLRCGCPRLLWESWMRVIDSPDQLPDAVAARLEEEPDRVEFAGRDGRHYHLVSFSVTGATTRAWVI